MFKLPTLSTALSKNCLSCSKYLQCKDKLKSCIYSCSQYKSTPASKDAGVLRLFDAEIIPNLPTMSKDYDRSPAIVDQNGFDIYKTIRKVIRKDSIVSPDIKIDDSDFKLAPNFFTFCTGDKFLNEKPFLEQALFGTIIFAEWCPRCSDRKWLMDHNVDDGLDIFQDRIQLLKHGKCPKCKSRKSELVANKELNYYYEAALCVGQRGGKSAWLGMASAYLGHWLLMLQNPNEIYGLLSSSILHGTFVALTYAQAKDTLWEPFYGYLLDSPFYQGYHEMLTSIGNSKGEELLKLKDTFVLYRHRRIFFYPAGPDKRTLRGRTRFLACLTGDTLVSTDLGLIEIKKDLIGLRSHSGHSVRNIINWAYTGKKEVFRLELENGLYEKATANHEMRVLAPDKKSLEWKRLDKLTTDDYMVVSLGGPFPSKLDLDFKYSYSREGFANHKALTYMLENSKGFYLLDVAEASGKTYRGVTAMMTHLKRSSVQITRKKDGIGLPMLYKIGDEHAMRKLIKKPLSGKINRLRNTLRFPKKLTVELAYLLGYLVADGTYIDINNDLEYGKEINFCSTNIDKINHFVECFTHTFGIAPRISSWDRGEQDRAFQVVFALDTIKQFLRYLGLKPAWARVKEVPWCILRAPRPCVAAFLSAALSCDGIIGNPGNYVSAGSCGLGYSSTSKKLIHHMQLLFIRLGYACNSNLSTGKRSLYSLTLMTCDRDWFMERDWCGLKKRASHEDYTQSGIVYNPVMYIIPSSNIDGKRVYTDNFFNQQHTTSVAQYSPLINKGYVFTRVKKVTPLGLKRVYDLSVDHPVHDFTANGLIVENSIDELGWMDNLANSQKVKMNANEVYIALERSLLTVRAASNKLIKKGFDNVPSGYFLNISSPSSVRDKIMELVRQSQGSRKIYGTIKATWEMNPTVTREDLEEEFRKDPVAALRDYGAQPPLSSSPFISSRAMVEQCFHLRKNPCSITYGTKKANDDTETRYAYFNKLKRTGKPSVLAIDAGYSNNSFACAVGHLVEDHYPVIDLLVEIQPLPGIPLNYSLIYEHIITPLLDKRNVKLFVADRWNSLKILSDAQADFEDCATKQISLKYPQMQMVKDYMQDVELTMPIPEISVDEILAYPHSEYPAFFKHLPVAHCVLQLLTVQDTGSSVIKGDQLTDDLARALMVAHCALVDPANSYYFGQEPEETPTSAIDVSKMGVYRGASGGSSSKGNSSSSSSSNLGLLKSRS